MAKSNILDLYRNTTQWEAYFFKKSSYISFHDDCPGPAKVVEAIASVAIAPFQLALSPLVNVGACAYFCVKGVQSYRQKTGKISYYLVAAGLAFLKAGITSTIILMAIFVYSPTMGIISVSIPIAMIAIGNYVHLRLNIQYYGDNQKLCKNTWSKIEQGAEKGSQTTLALLTKKI